MRVLVVHNRYKQSGGEDVAFESEADLLRSNGHEVVRLVLDSAEIPDAPGPAEAARLAVGAVWSERGRTDVDGALRAFEPEVAHFHNTFPLVSPSAYAACRARGVPVVQTLHNYRLVCPNALAFRDGGPCEDCFGKRLAWPGVVHACYRGSRAQTAAVAGMLAFHKARRTWLRDVDVFVALSGFARDRLVAGGLPADRITVKPNFVQDGVAGRARPRAGFVFAGRLTEEKGVRTVLETWAGLDRPPRLRIAGDGPLRPVAEAAASALEEVEYLGPLPHAAVLAELRHAEAALFPSLLYESFPLAVVEAFASGTPVIASRRGAAAEIVSHEETGLLFEPGNSASLAEAVRRLGLDPPAARAYGRSARRIYEEAYSPERNYEQLMDVYARALGQAPSRPVELRPEPTPLDRVPVQPERLSYPVARG